jgi:hypothetical protein
MGAVGPNAILPRYIEKTTPKSARILDFGSGKNAIHTAYLKSKGFTSVFAFDIGENYNPKLHKKNALNYSYDVLFASNVLNIQPSKEQLLETFETLETLETLETIFKTAAKRFVFNYPQKPRYMSLPTTEIANYIHNVFGAYPKLKNNSPQTPIWEINSPTSNFVQYAKMNPANMLVKIKSKI